MKIHLEIHAQDRTPGYDGDDAPPVVLSVDSASRETVVHTLQAFLESAGLPPMPWQQEIRDLCEQNRISSKAIDRLSGEIRDLEDAALTARKLLGEVLLEDAALTARKKAGRASDKSKAPRLPADIGAQLRLAVTTLCGGVEGLEIIRPPTGN